jgi:hypothetical protein
MIAWTTGYSTPSPETTLLPSEFQSSFDTLYSHSVAPAKPRASTALQTDIMAAGEFGGVEPALEQAASGKNATRSGLIGRMTAGFLLLQG